ncbi:MAG TPA: DUF3105 domain-containing protein [Acidimicrobiales bacterium]|nr:DUF3105 domain-containing protein [Acidimicrobiales bacterium]
MRRSAALPLAFVLAAACSSGGDDPPESRFCRADTEMDVYSTDGAGVVHTDHPSYTGPLGNPPRYTVDPPSGGDHLTPSVPPGFYVGDGMPPDGALVHSLEHGYVIVWYRSAAEAQVARAVADQYARDVLVVERPTLSVPIAATAWGHRLLCEQADAGELAEFVVDRRNKAPEKVPH